MKIVSNANQGVSRWGISFIILTGVLVASFVITPFSEGLYTLCIFKNITGLPCPGCGMTRAFLYLGHGDILAALKLNPNSLLLFLIVISLWLSNIHFFVTNRKIVINLKGKEKNLLYFLSALLMTGGWLYNLFLISNL